MAEIDVDADVLRHAVTGAPLTRVDTLLQTKIKSPLKIGTIGFTPSGDFTVRVINRPEDRDDDAIVGTAPGAHIAFDLHNAWVKYKLSAKADTKVGFSAGTVKAGGDVELSDYRVHEATEDAWSAMRKDLASPRTLLDFDDVRKLAPGEALAMELGGSISASVSIAWSDVITTRLADILSEFPARQPVAVKLSKGAETSLTATVSDQFSVVISRTLDGHFRFAVKKAKSRTGTYAIEVGAGIEVNVVPAIEKALAPLFEAITGVAIEKAEALAQRIGIAPLTTDETTLVDTIARRLRLGTAGGREEAVRKAIGELKAKLSRQLTKALRWKVAAGLEYEYSRIDENTAIADFVVLDPARLKRDYELAIDGDLAALAHVLRTDAAAHALVRYLNETTLTRRSASGFSLGIGKWLQVSAKDQSAFTQTTRTSLDGFKLITSRGTRRYDEKNIPENDFEWIVDLKAQMQEFLEFPSSRDFDYGLHYAVVLERSALSRADLERMLDFAAMWDVCAPDASDLAEALGRRATVRVQLILDRDALEATLGVAVDDDAWAVPLAMAMPYNGSFAERRSYDARRDAYTAAWLSWLRRDVFPVKPKVHSGLTLLEERALPGSLAWVSGEGHAHLRQHLGSFSRGVRKLHEAMTTRQTPDSIGTAYAALQQFWSQRLYIAASGRWLLDRAQDAGAVATTSMEIEFDDTTIVS